MSVIVLYYLRYENTVTSYADFQKGTCNTFQFKKKVLQGLPI